MAWERRRMRRTPKKDSAIIPLVRTRIKVPQPPTKPLDIHSKDLIKKEYVNLDPWWYTLHRRGIKREKIGADPLEKRAVPREMVRGTLPERIMYNALVNLVHLTAGVDFDFQSSQAGGRIELGGIVADFLFPIMRIVIQVQGPTHEEFLRKRKDEEQQDILKEMGYTVFEIDDDLIYNESKFENWLRSTFNLGGVGVGTGGNYNTTMKTGVSSTPSMFSVYIGADEMQAQTEAIYDAAISTTESIINRLREM